MLNFLRRIGYGSFSPIFPGQRIMPLHAMISSCGFSIEKSTSYNWDGLKRGTKEFTIFQYTLSGMGMLDYEGKLFELPSGTAFITHVPHRHRYFLPQDSAQWEFIYFSLYGSEAIRIWLEIEKLNGPVAKFAANSSIINWFCKVYESGMKKKITSPYISSKFAYELLMALCDEILPKYHNLQTKSQGFDKVITYCIENIEKDIDVENMAEVSGLSRYHFSRLFKKYYGISPAEFLLTLRMKKAVSMIQNEKLSVKEIASSCGFSDPSYFCKVFRQYYNTSPGKFRKAEI